MVAWLAQREEQREEQREAEKEAEEAPSSLEKD